MRLDIVAGTNASRKGRRMPTRTQPGATATWLLREYGPLLPAGATAKILGFKSTDALKKARLARRLPFEMFTISGRRGWFASTAVVAAWIDAAAIIPVDEERHQHG